MFYVKQGGLKDMILFQPSLNSYPHLVKAWNEICATVTILSYFLKILIVIGMQKLER